MLKSRFFMLLTALVVLSSLVACGGSSQTIKILAGQSTTDAGIEKLIDDAVAAQYPDIELQWEIVDWGKDFQPKMQQYLQSGLPDIMIGKGQDVPTYAALNVLADLSGKPYLQNVLDAAVASGTVGGKTYGVIFNALYQGVYYSRQLFKEHNLSIPTTQAELQETIDKLNAAGITPFETHFYDLWSIGNITMQFAINDVFNKYPNWGDQFRAGKVSFATSPEYRTCYEYNKLIYDNTWQDETFSLGQAKADARLVQGQAAMKVSGSWSIQNFLDIDPNFDFGVFPFPNQTGDAKLIFEPNITFMVSAKTKQMDAIDKVLGVITGDSQLGEKIFNQTKTASMLKTSGPTFKNPSQSDIDKYAARNMIVDANSGNTQLLWGGFQDENAKDIATWLQGNMTLDEALQAADNRRAKSKP